MTKTCCCVLHLCFCAMGAFPFSSVLREQKMDTGSSLTVLRRTIGKWSDTCKISLEYSSYQEDINRNYGFLPTVVFLKKILRNTSKGKGCLDSQLLPSERQSLTPPQRWTLGREQDKTAIALMKQNNSSGIRFGFQQTAPAEVSTQAARAQKGFSGPYSPSQWWVMFFGKITNLDPNYSWKRPLTLREPHE